MEGFSGKANPKRPRRTGSVDLHARALVIITEVTIKTDKIGFKEQSGPGVSLIGRGRIEAMETLRTRLRRDTQTAHANLDRVITAFDVASVPGLKAFLSLQRHALTTLTKTEPFPACAPMMQDLLVRIDEDQRKIGATGPLAPDPFRCHFHPKAIDYVMAGSRLGTTVLRRQWEASKSDLVQQTNAYFSAPSYIEYWQQFSKDAADMSGDTGISAQICADAGLIFEFYTFHATDLLPETKRMQTDA